MKNLTHILIAAVLAAWGLTLPSCGSPKIIPDDELARIFRDAYLTNAYTQSKTMQLDSLNIYEPIFEKHGYTTEDFQYTIGNFAKRKSAKLSDVVDEAVDLLRKENDFYKWRVAVYDTVGTIARERYARLVYTDTLIRATKIADTARLRIEIPVDRVGTYEVSYSYFLDSLDRNKNLRFNHYLLDDRKRQSKQNSRRLRQELREEVKASFDAGEQHRKLVLDFNSYPKDLTRPSLRIDTLVVRYLLPDPVARDSMGRSFFGRRAQLDTLANPVWNASRGDTIRYVRLPEEAAGDL